MIASFADKRTADLYHGRPTGMARRWPPELVAVALRKLDMVHAAQKLDDLSVPPSNRLKVLRGNLKGFFSIRINDQWRITFRWKDAQAHDVSIVDYH